MLSYSHASNVDNKDTVHAVILPPSVIGPTGTHRAGVFGLWRRWPQGGRCRRRQCSAAGCWGCRASRAPRTAACPGYPAACPVQRPCRASALLTVAPSLLSLKHNRQFPGHLIHDQQLWAGLHGISNHTDTVLLGAGNEGGPAEVGSGAFYAVGFKWLRSLKQGPARDVVHDQAARAAAHLLLQVGAALPQRGHRSRCLCPLGPPCPLPLNLRLPVNH